MNSRDHLFYAVPFCIRFQILRGQSADRQPDGEQQEIMGIPCAEGNTPVQQRQEQGCRKTYDDPDTGGDSDPFQDADEQDGFFDKAFFHRPFAPGFVMQQ